MFEAKRRCLNNGESLNSDDQKVPEDDQWLKPRKIPTQNILLRLMQRESNYPKMNSSTMLRSRHLHQNVCPNFTIMNIEKPPCFLRKFSPDGHHLIAFSSDQTSIEIYKYRGAASSAHLFINERGEYTNKADIRASVFDSMFTSKHIVSVANNGEQLNRECSLFTDDGKFLIVGSAAIVSEDDISDGPSTSGNNETLSPNPRIPLENYTLHLIHVESGKLCDRQTYKNEKIFLSHNQGLYLYGHTLAVLAVHTQTIYIYKINEQNRTLTFQRAIGQFCFDDDQLVTTVTDDPGHHESHNLINSLKHRLLVYLYNMAVENNTIRQFYHCFEASSKLRMWKMQLLDETHLFIRYSREEVIYTSRISDPGALFCFFVLYDIETGEVQGVYDNSSDYLLKLFEENCDLFRNQPFCCSPSNNSHARLLQHRFKQTIVNARFGGHVEATRRLLAQLPISAQSYSASPYLDMALFSYDDKWISVLERPKSCGDYPIRFYGRDSGLLKFRIYAGNGNLLVPQRKLVAFTFHPFDPFAISVQRTNLDYVVNFHVYNSKTHPSSSSA